MFAACKRAGDSTMQDSESVRVPHGSASGEVSAWIRGKQTALVLLVLLVATGIAATWLVFPYLVKDQNLLQAVGGDVKQEHLLRSISIGRFLSRTTFGAGEAQVDMLYAPPKFFEVTDRADAVGEYRPDLYLVFLVTETTHIEDLPEALPDARLFVDDVEFKPYDVEGPLVVYHHRVLSVRFPAFADDGEPIVTDNTSELRLELTNSWDPGGGTRIASWQLPLEYPAEVQNGSVWTPLLVLGVSAGLLSFVLTPCLLQLILIYVAALAGFTVAASRTESEPNATELKRKVLTTAVAFVLGFSLLFTATGAAIGHAGKEAQMFFSTWSSTITVVAGILVIIMGIWIGLRARTPLICRIVPQSVQTQIRKPSTAIGAALTAAGFSLGCMTCFGGAIIATLLIYVGAIGSAFIGAMVMMAFSLGVVIPFILAALFLSRALPLLSRIQQLAPQIGLVSMLVMVAFGMVLVTDNFHVVSDFIYPYLKLS